MRAARVHRRSVLSRVVRVVLAVVASIVAVATVLVVGTLVFLRTPRGGDLIRKAVLPRVNARIAGHLDVARLKFGGNSFHLEGIELRGPERERVVRIASIDVGFSPFALLRRHVLLTRLVVERPVVDLVQDARGLNLTRALRERVASAPSKTTEGRIEIRLLRIAEGRVAFRSATGSPPDARVDALRVDGAGHVDLGSGDMGAHVHLDARVGAPLQAPLVLDAEVRRAAGDARGALTVDLGAARLSARGALDARGVGRLDVDRIHFPPAVANALFPAARLNAAVDGQAALGGAGGRWQARVDLGAAGGNARVEAEVDLPARRVHDLAVTALHVDLGGVRAGLPVSDLSLLLRARDLRARGEQLDDLEGELRLLMKPGSVAGLAVGPGHLEASAARGTLSVSALHAELAGASVDARGTLAHSRLDARLDLRARNLGETSRRLGAARVGGDGRLRAHVTGTLAAPAVTLDGHFANLRVGDASARGLTVAAHWPNARRPLVAGATVRIATAELQGRALRDVAADLEARGRSFALSLRGTDGTAISLDARGEWRDDHRALTLASLTLATPEERWAQTGRPIEIVSQRRGLRVSGLDLRAGAQRVAADVELDAGRLRAALDVAALDLRLLPKVIFSGGAPAARIDLHGRLDVPTRWSGRTKATPVLGNLELRVHDAGSLLPLLGVTRAKIEGPVAVTVDLAGTAGAPRLSARAQVGGLSVDEEKVGDVTLAIRGEGSGPTLASLTLGPAASGAVAGAIELSTSLSLSRLLAQPPRGDEWMRTPFEATGDLRALPLRALARAAPHRAPLEGTLGVRFAAHGTLAAPQGALHLEARAASPPRFPATDLRADVAFGARDLRIAARLSRVGSAAGGDRLLAWLSGVARIPANRLDERDALERAPLDVHFGVAPVEVQRQGVVVATPAAGAATDETLRGRVHLEGSLTGTALAPVAKVALDADSVTMGGAALGHGHAELSYQRGRARVNATLASAAGGALRLAARADADLGLRAVVHGFDPARVPLEASLEAERFDLRWLSGVTRMVRSVAGSLTASVQVHGTAAAPRIAGRIEWTKGALALAGLGDYQHVHVLAHGDGAEVILDDVSGESLGGHARLTGALARAADGGRLRLKAHLDRFPIYGQGQIFGRVSVEASAHGTLAGSALDVQTSISEARLELEETERRKLPPLTRPDDVVLLEHGKPVDGEAAKALRKDEGLPAPPAPAFSARLTVDAPRNIWVRGEDVNVEVGVEPGFHVDLGAEPSVEGRIVIRRGHVDVVGRRFDLQADSSAEFSGPPATPVVDVTAKHAAASLNVTVIVTVKGPLDRLTFNVSAPERPDLTETQLYTLIVSGRVDLGAAGPSTSATSAAASLVGGVLASQLQRVLGGALPLDVLTFETSQGLAGSRVEAGKNLGSRLYLGYVGRAGANPGLLQNRNAVRLEYQFTARWSLDAEYGDVGTGTADLFWTKRY